MAKLFPSLVLLAIISALLFQQSVGKNQNKIRLLSVRQNFILSVKEGGGIIATPYTPTLFSLIRVKMYPPEGLMKESSKFTLEGIAAGHRICMGKNGLITTQDMKIKRRKKKKETTTGASRGNGTMKTQVNPGIPQGHPPPPNCIFQSLTFNSSVFYKFGTAIYSPAPNNASVGQFIAFNRMGKLRRYRRPLSNVTNHAISIHLIELKNMNPIITATKFAKCEGKVVEKQCNRKIRVCIRKRKKATMLSHIRHSNVLFRAIQKCQRSGKKSKRSNITENSLQRVTN